MKNLIKAIGKLDKDKYPIHRFARRSMEEVEAWEDGYDEAVEKIIKIIEKEIKKEPNLEVGTGMAHALNLIKGGG